jgi:hypothetical protein
VSLGWRVVEKWGADLYGDPCRECGFGWKLSPAQAVASVRAIPGAYTSRLAGATGRERHPDLAWTTAVYVSHVTDNLRTWAERLAGGYLSCPRAGRTAPRHQLDRQFLPQRPDPLSA